MQIAAGRKKATGTSVHSGRWWSWRAARRSITAQNALETANPPTTPYLKDLYSLPPYPPIRIGTPDSIRSSSFVSHSQLANALCLYDRAASLSASFVGTHGLRSRLIVSLRSTIRHQRIFVLLRARASRDARINAREAKAVRVTFKNALATNATALLSPFTRRSKPSHQSDLESGR